VCSSDLEHAIELQNRAELIGSLHETMYEFTTTLQKARGPETLVNLSQTLAESSHVLLLSAIDALDSRDADDLALISVLAADRANMMARIRGQALKVDPPLDAEQQQIVFAATNLFERQVWLLKRFALALGAPTAAEPEDTTTAS
jgi:hypothetical protein